jgi:cyclase
MVRLADGVYAILHDDAIHDWPSGATDWPHSNTGVVVGDDGVLVVDATFYPSRARADIALIRSVTNKPVRYLVNTHWHGDHTHGNGAYRDAFPNVAIVSARENRDFIALNLARYPKNALAAGSTTRAALAKLEAIQASGKDSAGRALTAAERSSLAAAVRERRTQLEEFAAIRIAAPDLVFDHELTLVMGHTRVVLRDRDRANSPHDVTVYLPDERVLFTGDILVHPVPYAMASHPVPWVGVLREVEATPVAALVPGHGPVMRDHAYTRQVRELFEAAQSRVAALLREGKSLEEVQRTVTLDDFRPRFVIGEDPTAVAYWDYSIKNTLIERTYQCVVGYRC